MRSLPILLMPFLALVAGPVAFLLSGPVDEAEPVLVIAPPWGDPALVVVARAGGHLLGPQDTTFATLAFSDVPDFPDRLRRSGAMAVLSGTRIAALCGV